jgi:hypothetical protein
MWKKERKKFKKLIANLPAFMKTHTNSENLYNKKRNTLQGVFAAH